MKEIKRNKETGILEVWEDGKKVGEIVTMGDALKNGYQYSKGEDE